MSRDWSWNQPVFRERKFRSFFEIISFSGEKARKGETIQMKYRFQDTLAVINCEKANCSSEKEDVIGWDPIMSSDDESLRRNYTKRTPPHEFANEKQLSHLSFSRVKLRELLHRPMVKSYSKFASLTLCQIGFSLDGIWWNSFGSFLCWVVTPPMFSWRRKFKAT